MDVARLHHQRAVRETHQLVTAWGAPRAIWLTTTPGMALMQAYIPIPAHLWLGWQREQPLKSLLHRPLRGVPLIRAASFRFTAPEFIEQNEAGDTAAPTFDWPDTEPTQGLHWFLTNNPGDSSLAATSPPYQWPWRPNVPVPVYFHARMNTPVSVGAVGPHDLLLDTIEQGINFPGGLASTPGVLQNIPAGLWNLDVTIQMFSTGTGRWRLLVDTIFGDPNPFTIFRESANEARATYTLSFSFYAPTSWSWAAVLFNDGAANAAVLGDGSNFAIDVRGSMIQAA